MDATPVVAKTSGARGLRRMPIPLEIQTTVLANREEVFPELTLGENAGLELDYE